MFLKAVLLILYRYFSNPESTTAPSPSTTAAEKPVKNEDLAVEAAEPEFALAKDAPPEISERMESQGVPTAR